MLRRSRPPSSSPAPTRSAFPTKAPNIAPPAPRCSPRRSSCAVTSSASRRSAGRCRPAGRSSATTGLRAKTGRPTSPACSRQRDAGRLQLHVRAPARAPVPDVHQPAGRLGGQCGRHRSERVARRRRALADRAPDRLEARTRLEATFASSATSTAPIRATISASPPTARTFPPSTCSPAATGRSAISGRVR